jgi:replicative DNA helicase
VSGEITRMAEAFGSQSAFDTPSTTLFDDVAETQVLGSILARKGAFDEVLDSGVSGASFYKPAHQTIFNAIADMHAEGKPIDSITVGEEMLRRGESEMCGGVAYLHQMVQSVPTSWNVSHYADIVRERWIVRELHYTGIRLQQSTVTLNGAGEVTDMIARARSMVDELVDLNTGHLSSEEDILDEVIAELSGPKNYTPTPWRELNVAIGGWRKQTLNIIGARPSVGKTAVACEIMLDAMRRGMFPILFSLEMPKDQIVQRLLSNIGNVDGLRMLHHSLRGDDEDNLAMAAAELRRHRYQIDDRSRMTIPQMRATIRSMQRQKMPVLVIVDYLQIIKAATKTGDRRVDVDEIAQGLKDLSKDCDVPVVALAQLSREIEGRANPEPTMRDLREAGGIENAADNIALLHRAVQDPAGQGNLGWLIAKARFGRVCTFATRFEGEYSRVTDYTAFGGVA